MHLACPRGVSIDRAALADGLAAARGAALSWAVGQSFSPTDPPIARFELPEPGLARLVAPLRLPEGLVGLLSVVGGTNELGEPECLAAARGAAACALPLAAGCTSP